MKVAAIIPARAGSKRLRNKNTADLGGLPLWRHAVAQARASGACDPIVVSTNDPAIIQGWDDSFVVLNRPESLARDDTPTMPVVCHMLEYLYARPDAVAVLQPTSPLRTGEDIAACVRMMEELGCDSVVSVTEGPDDLAFQVRHAGRMERLPRIVVPNGAIFLVRTSVIEEGGGWYGDNAYAYVMPKERSVDINVQFDLDVARLYLSNMKAST